MLRPLYVGSCVHVAQAAAVQIRLTAGALQAACVCRAFRLPDAICHAQASIACMEASRAEKERASALQSAGMNAPQALLV